MTNTNPSRRFGRYPEYKDSGVAWLGEIPAHWEVKRLRYAMTMNPSKSEVRGLAPDTPVSFVPMEAVGESGGLVLETVKPLAATLEGYTYFRDDDVVIAKITPCFENGKGALASGLENGIAFGTTELHVLRATKHMDSRFLFYLTLSDPFRRLGAAAMYGAGGQKRVPEDFVKDLEHPIPNLSDQRAIVAFLNRESGRIDVMVAMNEHLIELLEEQRTAVITRAVTKGLNAMVPMKNSGIEWLGQVPSHWALAKMWHVGAARSGGTPAKDDPTYWNGTIPWVSPKDMKRRFIDSAKDSITDRALEETGLRLFAPPVVLVVVRGMILAHSLPIAMTTVPVTINQDMKALTFRSDVHPQFVVWLFEGIGKAVLASIVEEAGHGTKTVRMDEWRLITIPIPPEPEQLAITGFLDRETARIDALVHRIRDAVERLGELRTAFISAAVTGKIDVRDEAT